MAELASDTLQDSSSLWPFRDMSPLASGKTGSCTDAPNLNRKQRGRGCWDSSQLGASRAPILGNLIILSGGLVSPMDQGLSAVGERDLKETMKTCR